MILYFKICKYKTIELKLVHTCIFTIITTHTCSYNLRHIGPILICTIYCICLCLIFDKVFNMFYSLFAFPFSKWDNNILLFASFFFPSEMIKHPINKTFHREWHVIVKLVPRRNVALVDCSISWVTRRRFCKCEPTIIPICRCRLGDKASHAFSTFGG